MVTIEWFGHSYIRITGEKGPSIVIDPHDGGSLNLPEFRVHGDIVLVTHDHYDHNAVEMIQGAKLVLSQFRGSKRLENTIIQGYKTYHDKTKGKLRGENTVYIVKINNIKIAHLGDIGHKPSDRLLEALRDVHVLMIPVGGVYTIDAYEAWEIVEETQAKIVLPLHFWVPHSTTPLDPLGKFLNIAKAGRTRLDTNKLSISTQGLQNIKRTVVVMPDPYSFHEAQ